MIHRHVAYPEGTPAERLPSAAIVDLLDRGDLAAWRPLAVAIARDPLGALAERVMRLVDAYPMYGTSPLWRTWIDRCRARAEGAREPHEKCDLAALRRRAGLTQKQVAARIGMSQSDLSKLERREDVRLSTLRAYAKALGGRFEAVFAAGSQRLEIRPGASRPDVRPAPAPSTPPGPPPSRGARRGRHGGAPRPRRPRAR